MVKDDSYRYVCYGGFAKEFINFVYGRDVRKIADASKTDLIAMKDACLLAETEEGQNACVEFSIYSLYRVGMYPYTLAGKYCSLHEGIARDVCFNTLFESVTKNITDSVDRKKFCVYIDDIYQPLCTEGGT